MAVFVAEATLFAMEAARSLSASWNGWRTHQSPTLCAPFDFPNVSRVDKAPGSLFMLTVSKDKPCALSTAQTCALLAPEGLRELFNALIQSLSSIWSRSPSLGLSVHTAELSDNCSELSAPRV